MENYIGAVVFFDSESNYPRSDEILVVRQSPNRLFGVSTSKGFGYGSHELVAVDLVGKTGVQIVNVSIASKAFLTSMAESLEYFGNTPKRGDKPQWIDYVYTGALRNAGYVREILEKLEKKSQPVESPPRLSKQLSDIAAILQNRGL